jgi:hypothetical protein
LGLRAETPGQGTGPESIGSLNRDSNAGYPENIPSRIVPSRSQNCHPAEGGCTWTLPTVDTLSLRKTGEIQGRARPRP